MGRIRHLWIEGDKPGIIVVDVDPPLADDEIEIQIDMGGSAGPGARCRVDGCSSPTLDETLNGNFEEIPASRADEIAMGAMIAMTARRHP